MTESFEPAADLQAYERLAKALTQEQLLALVCAELPTCLRLRQRLDVIAAGTDGKAAATLLRQRLTSLLKQSSYTPAGSAAGVLAPYYLLLEQIQRHLCPLEPKAALSITQRLIESDEALFQRIDDSNGTLGGLLREAARVWLICAKASGLSEPQLADKALALFLADEYGTRETLLEEADTALSDRALRELAQRCEAAFRREAKETKPTARDRHDRNLTALGLIARALKDPQMAASAVLLRSPVPNEHQSLAIARTYLEFNQPRQALPWLEKRWDGYVESERLSVLDAAYTAIGDMDRVIALRCERFERHPTDEALDHWLQVLSGTAADQAKQQARTRAQDLDDPVAGAQILLTLGDVQGAQAVIVTKATTLNGRFYSDLIELAQVLTQSGANLGAIACYRALLEDILTRARSTAYDHAAQYWFALERLSAQIADFTGLEPHADYAAAIRARHRLKSSFWRRVQSKV